MSSANQYHIQARWITVGLENGGLIYFKLDDNGDLVLTDGEIVPDHFEYQNHNNGIEFDENIANFNQSLYSKN